MRRSACGHYPDGVRDRCVHSPGFYTYCWCDRYAYDRRGGPDGPAESDFYFNAGDSSNRSYRLWANDRIEC